jgi:hypothetical protein
MDVEPEEETEKPAPKKTVKKPAMNAVATKILPKKKATAKKPTITKKTTSTRIEKKQVGTCAICVKLVLIYY